LAKCSNRIRLSKVRLLGSVGLGLGLSLVGLVLGSELGRGLRS